MNYKEIKENLPESTKRKYSLFFYSITIKYDLNLSLSGWKKCKATDTLKNKVSRVWTSPCRESPRIICVLVA